MPQTGCFRQVFSMLKRNMIIKGRVKKQMITEFLWPILFIIILALIRHMAKVSTVKGEAVTDYPVEGVHIGAGLQGEVLVVPLEASNFVSKALSEHLPNYTLTVKGFNSTMESHNYYREQSGHLIVCGVIFSDESLYNYTIRTPFVGSASPELLLNEQEDCRPTSTTCSSKSYLYSGFLMIQSAINSALLSEAAGVRLPEIETQQMPKPSFIPDSSFIRQFAPVYYVYIYSFFIQFLAVGLVSEKKTRMKETLRIMGLRDSAFWLSWALLYLIIIGFVTAIAVIFARLTTFFRPPSNFLIFFIMLSLYGVSIINLAFVLTPFLNNPNVAGPVSVLATTAVSALFVIVSVTTRYDANGTPSSLLPVSVQWLLCLLSPTALSIAIERAIYLDVAQIGLSWSSLLLGDFPLYAPILMLAVDSVLYFMLAIYLDNVIPGEFGQAKHICYCMQPGYWRSKGYTADQIKQIDEEFRNSSSCKYIEPVAEEMIRLNKLRILDIKKSYRLSSKLIHAVKGITLEIYENEITCLLGHNGAGKTTLMNMLTGLTTPTSGTALLYDLDIRHQNHMTKIRNMTGLCPQYDVLVDDMTCREHLKLYASLKGISEVHLSAEVEKILREVDLIEKADCFTKNLSGGQKRKLSVGIAFIGNPKIVFLDEPSAGMDPKSRRHLWALLKNKKYGRIILLTTHFMDEADILADRKAIVSKGRLRCCGSSLYLKTKFGIGYNLNLVVHPKHYKKAEVELMVADHISGAKLSHSHGMEVCFSLPLEQADRFCDLFRKLEEPCNDKGTVKRAALLGITNYGISMTTLEEVFLRLAEIAESEDAEVTDLRVLGKSSSQRLNQTSQQPPVITQRSRPDLPRLADILTKHDSNKRPTSIKILRALIKVRFLISIRDKMATFSRVVLPIILILIAVIILRLASIQYNPPLESITLDYKGTFHDFKSRYALFNTTGSDPYNMQSFITKTMGLPHREVTNITDLLLRRPYLFGFDYYIDSQDFDVIRILYNDTWVHSLPFLLNLVSNSVLAASSTNISIETSSMPWSSLHPRYVFHGSIFTFGLMLGFALTFLPTSFAQAAVNDRILKAKSQLRIAGLAHKLYWFSICTVDWLQYMMIGVFLIICFAVFQIRPLTEPGAVLSTIIFLLLYIPIYMLALYIISYWFDVPYTSQGLIQTLIILLNIALYVPVGMSAMSENDLHIRVADSLHITFTFINPFYTASGFFMYLLKFDTKQSFIQQTSNPTIPVISYFYWENMLLPVHVAGFIWLPILLVLLRVVDMKKSGHSIRAALTSRSDGIDVKRNSYIIEEEDEDVAKERHCVEHNVRSSVDPEKPVLIVKSLRKEFHKQSVKQDSRRMIAVKNLSFKVAPGEVLGLLGPNGAGKSTTMNMLTAEITPDSGMVQTGTTNIHADLREAFSKMGYCPQFDAVWTNLTIREHLAAYIVVRGYHPEAVEDITEYFIELLHLEEHADKRSFMLSGGTKRKLSFAMAMLGDPKIVLLDEPSTGMDPQSKRQFWDAINHSFERSDRGAILTTHYMEEADALCHRIAIMINGQLECLGTSQHLKNRFGNGYQLEVKLATMKESVILTEMDKLHAFIFYYFPNTHILEQFGPRVSYRIAANDVSSLSRSFEILETGKREIQIGEYSFSQATLEQVFLQFAKYQMEENNTTVEQNERSHDIAQSRKVSAMHSKRSSYVALAGTTNTEELRQLEKQIDAAVARYVEDVTRKAQTSGYVDLESSAPRQSSDEEKKQSEDITARDSQVYSIYKKDQGSVYGFTVVNPYPMDLRQPGKPALKRSSHSYRSLRTNPRVANKPSKKEGERSVVKFDTRIPHDSASTLNTGRHKVFSQDIIEADEERREAPRIRVDVPSMEKQTDSFDDVNLPDNRPVTGRHNS